MLDPKILVCKKILGPKKFKLRLIKGKKFLVKKNFWVKNNFWSKKFWAETNLGQNILDQKKFYVHKKILVQKIFWVQKNFRSKNISGPKIFLVLKKFVLKKNSK